MREQEKKNLEWDIGSYRIHYIGEVVNQVRTLYSKALNQKTIGALREYLVGLDTLYTDIRPYLRSDEEEVMEKLDERLEKLHEQVNDFEEENREELLNKLRSFDQDVNEVRIDIGLDIPSKSQPEPGKELV